MGDLDVTRRAFVDYAVLTARWLVWWVVWAFANFFGFGLAFALGRALALFVGGDVGGDIGSSGVLDVSPYGSAAFGAGSG